MFRNFFLFALISGLHVVCLAQTNHTKIDLVKKEFTSFDYQTVIHLADSLIEADSTLTDPDFIELNRMKGISQFVLGQEYNARNSFLKILKLDPVFQLDPVQNSPKIIQFFNDLKLTFLQNELVTRSVENESDPLLKSSSDEAQQVSAQNLNPALWRSIFIPGWGHHYLGRNKKGTYLIMGSVVLLAPAVYYSADTFQKEKDYLNETERSLIKSKYDRYNKSYKMRNAFIAGYALLWLYSQLDLFSGDPIQKHIELGSAVLQDGKKSGVAGVSLKINF